MNFLFQWKQNYLGICYYFKVPAFIICQSFWGEKSEAVKTLPPAKLRVGGFGASVSPRDHWSSVCSSSRRTPPSPGCPTSDTAATTHQHRAQIAAQLLGEGPVHLSGIEKFWSQFEDFLVHKALAGNVVSIKWDVNFHEYFPHGCSLWSLSNLAITMRSVGYTAWVKFKKLAASQWGEGQSSNLCVFTFFFFFLLCTSGDGWFFTKSLGATICLNLYVLPTWCPFTFTALSFSLCLSD